MNYSSKIPAFFLIVAMSVSGAAVATAQSSADTVENDGGQSSFRLAHGPRRGGDMMMPGLLQDIDSNGDNAITQAEIDAFRTAQVAAADTSGDGNISLQEFEAIFNAAVQDRRVDAFQRLDADGDGQVTPAEIDARFGNIVERMDRNDDGQLDRDDRRRGDGPRRNR